MSLARCVQKIPQLSLIFVLAVMGLLGRGIASGDKGAEELYRMAMEQVGRVSAEESLSAFRKVLEADEGFAPACLQMAKLHISRRTPVDRQTAERLLRRAIRLAPPGEMEYRVALADLMWLQGFWLNARREYEKILEQDPGNAGAAYGIGYSYAKEFMKYLNMIDFEGENPVMLEWRHFGEDYRDKALHYLDKSIELDPRSRDAYY